METKRYRLARDGEKDLSFEGTRIASASSHYHSGPSSNRWIELDLYQTKAGSFVVACIHKTCWQGEEDRFKAYVFDEPGELVGFLEGEDGFISDLDKELVDEATKVDPAFDAVLVEAIA